jgi:ATP-dependent Clp protease ATP-binding subunit ClpX
MKVEDEDKIEYGIKYKVHRLDENKYLLFPISLLRGSCDAYTFTTEDGVDYKIANYKEDLNNKYVVDKVYFLNDLEDLFDFDYDGSDFLPKYFYEHYNDKIIYVDCSENSDILKKNELNVKDFVENQFDETYFVDKNTPIVALNQDMVNFLRNLDSMDDIRLMLDKYETQLEAFKDSFYKKGVNKVTFENGRIKSYESNKKIEQFKPSQSDKNKKGKQNSKEITYKGLCDYIKERVFGHDDEIDSIAKTLYLNTTAKKGDPVKSVLITGPTGVGKTETIKAASEYLDIPYIEVNAANIVPQGIKGMSIEDVLVNLYIMSSEDKDKAERGLVFLDEFDKLNENADLEIKSAVKHILLTFTQGGTFPIDNDQYSFAFNTAMLSKAFGGVFEKIRSDGRKIGFGSENNDQNDKQKKLSKESVIRDLIIEKQYFSQEELDRINKIIEYGDLDRDTRKRIILYSKISELELKKNRFKRDFGVDIIPDDSYIDAILDEIDKKRQGMRVVNNLIEETTNEAEKSILLYPDKYKKLVLTKKTVLNPKDFDAS